MHHTTSALLLQSAHESGYKSTPSAVIDLPRRRPHSQRQEAQQIASILFPDYSPEKAIVQYEQQRKDAVAAYRSKEAARQAKEKLRLEGNRPDRPHDPWDPVSDPVSLPPAAPMPVRVGGREDFEDCFAFLRSDAGGRVEALLNTPDHSSSALPSLRATVGAEPVYNSRLLEFKRGVVYEDGRLDLCKMVVGPDHIDELMASLEDNTHIRHFLLGNNVITNHGARRIARFVTDHPGRMRTWYLAGNHIKPAGLRELAAALCGSEALENLWLKRNPLGPSSVGDLLAVARTAGSLKVLDVETCELGDAGIAELFDGLAAAPPNSLETIYINGNGVGPGAAAAIARFLTSPHCRMKYLMMSGNPLGDAGALALADGVSRNTTLEVLTLASCGLSSKGVSAICNALVHHPRIRHLDLASRFTTGDLGQRFNHIGDDAIEAISAVTTNPNLHFLELGYVALSPDGLEQIRDAVFSSSSSLVGFEAVRVTGPHVGESAPTPAAAATPAAAPTPAATSRSPTGPTCSLRVRRALEANYMRLYGGEGQMAEGVPYAEFISRTGPSRLLRNSPAVRVIDSVYRTRDKGKTATGKARKYWDLELDAEERRLWERLDAIE